MFIIFRIEPFRSYIYYETEIYNPKFYVTYNNFNAQLISIMIKHKNIFI